MVSCETCHSATYYGAINGELSCAPCERACAAYKKASGTDADADYAYHELAHHVILFRALPRKRGDWCVIEQTIDLFPIGRSQLHELRVLALQFVAQERLGWKPKLERLVELSWPGIREVVLDGRRTGEPAVGSEKEAVDRIRALVAVVSPRNLGLYTRAVRALRGDS
jgi:hypothetical protein